MFVMFLLVVREDDDVVEIGEAEESEVGSEGGIDESLEDGWGGGKSHGHYFVFVESKHGFEGQLPFVSFCNTDVIEACSNVKFGKDVGFSQAIDDFS